MSRAGQLDKTIQSLLPLETYRSPWVPTRRLGTEALVAIAAPFRQVDDTTVAPSVWFAATPDLSALLAFAHTRIVTPVQDFRPGPIERTAIDLSAKNAHAVLWGLADSMWADFFDGRAPAAVAVQTAPAALDATVPSRLRPWLQLCCSDFFEWLNPGGSAEADSPAQGARPL